MSDGNWAQPALDNEPEVKHCSRCGTTRPVTEFTPRGRGRAGYQSWCRGCFRVWNRLANRRRRGLPADFPTFELRSLVHARPVGHTYTHRGYVLVKAPDHHRANRHGWVFQHILAAEQKYGFPITREFTVHHLNGDKVDNRPDNLELRYGNHGKGADVIPALMRLPEMRAVARAVLAQYQD